MAGGTHGADDERRHAAKDGRTGAAGATRRPAPTSRRAWRAHVARVGGLLGARGGGVARLQRRRARAALRRLPRLPRGWRILFPRWAIDRLVSDPDGADRSDGGEADAPVERVLTLLPLLSGAERVRVAQAALSPTGAADGDGAR